MLSYIPADFWGVAFAVRGSALPTVFWRSVGMCFPAFVSCFLIQFRGSIEGKWCTVIRRTDEDDSNDTCFEEIPNNFVTPFALLVALLTAYRLHNAHSKWERANGTAMSLHEVTRLLMCRLCATFEPTQENIAKIADIRRLMVLGCVSVQKNLLREKTWNDELSTGLVKPEEVEVLRRTATVSVRDGKRDRFPTRVSPSFFFFHLHRSIHALFKSEGAEMSPVRAMFDQDVARMAGAFESIELLNMTVLPVAYAQLTRLVCVCFLILLPFTSYITLVWGTIPLAFAVNMIYFTVDHCSSEMEAPFGDDEMDVDLAKIVRRIDKFTAAIFSLYVNEVVPNYDIYPETRFSDANNIVIGDRLKCGSSG